MLDGPLVREHRTLLGRAVDSRPVLQRDPLIPPPVDTVAWRTAHVTALPYGPVVAALLAEQTRPPLRVAPAIRLQSPVLRYAAALKAPEDARNARGIQAADFAAAAVQQRHIRIIAALVRTLAPHLSNQR